jgi:toxin ParE1/3/4
MNVILTKEADKDLTKILRYSLLNFGKQQANKYYSGLKNKVDNIFCNFVISSDYDHILKGLRRTNYESHAIYYIVEDETIVIIRILGQRQEISRHLN